MRFLLILLTITGLDQILKTAARLYLANIGEVPVVEPFFYLNLVKNDGAAFGMWAGNTSVFIGVAIIAVLGIAAYVIIERPPALVDLALACIAGGAAGNLIDRLVHGGVIDYLDFRVWPVFNFADMAIVLGAFLIITVVLREERRTGD